MYIIIISERIRLLISRITFGYCPNHICLLQFVIKLMTMRILSIFNGPITTLEGNMETWRILKVSLLVYFVKMEECLFTSVERNVFCTFWVMVWVLNKRKIQWSAEPALLEVSEWAQWDGRESGQASRLSCTCPFCMDTQPASEGKPSSEMSNT